VQWIYIMEMSSRNTFIPNGKITVSIFMSNVNSFLNIMFDNATSRHVSCERIIKIMFYNAKS